MVQFGHDVFVMYFAKAGRSLWEVSPPRATAKECARELALSRWAKSREERRHRELRDSRATAGKTADKGLVNEPPPRAREKKARRKTPMVRAHRKWRKKKKRYNKYLEQLPLIRERELKEKTLKFQASIAAAVVRVTPQGWPQAWLDQPMKVRLQPWDSPEEREKKQQFIEERKRTVGEAPKVSKPPPRPSSDWQSYIPVYVPKPDDDVRYWADKAVIEYTEVEEEKLKYPVVHGYGRDTNRGSYLVALAEYRRNDSSYPYDQRNPLRHGLCSTASYWENKGELVALLKSEKLGLCLGCQAAAATASGSVKPPKQKKGKRG